MKVLIVNDYASPSGGAEVQMLTLRDGLRARGHDARLFASRARPVEGPSPADYECFGTTGRFRTLLQTANPWAPAALRRALAEFRPDVVHVGMFLTQLSPLILPLLRDVPSLYHVHWYRPVCPRGTKMLTDGSACGSPAGVACLRGGCLPLHDWALLMQQMRLWRRGRGAFDRIVAVSDAVRQRLLDEGIGPVEVVWNGVPVSPEPAPFAPRPTVAFAGRLVLEKGVDVLLRAFAEVAAQVPAARLIVAGDGPERERLRRMIGELDLDARVVLPGHLSRRDLECSLAGAWVQAVPSRWDEPFGLVAAEAMMRGAAVVASASGGLAEIVRDGETGFLVPPGDAGALARALLPLLRDRARAERMGAAGRVVAETHFSEAACVDRFVGLYDDLCRGRDKEKRLARC